MFTGLIEELGKVSQINKGTNSAVLTIRSGFTKELKIGDSIAVNGVCLTAVDKNDNSFQVEVMEETLQKTNLGELKIGSPVNLERALQIGGRLDGHIVSGHVDGTGTIKSFTTRDIALLIKISTSENILRYLVPKGSVAVDGISLTVVDVMNDYFTISLIPHTRKITTLGTKGPGDTVNLEVDVLAKYVEKLIVSKEEEPKNKRNDINIKLLRENGFM